MEGNAVRRYVGNVLLFGKEITVAGTDTGKGMSILISGGDQAHIGAVSVSSPDRAIQTIEFPGHREGIVCKKWAQEIGRKYSYPVVVSAGIHYDGATGEQIREILGALDEMLQELCIALLHPPGTLFSGED